ncbi:cation:dicarboxylate symporter family transporter [Paragemmobacter aquarius]|nr:cation:dicarboxylase symporter family transporter [Gemmobacter aquarius]
MLRLLTSGPGVLAAAILGVWLGTLFAFDDLPDRFQQIYSTIYRTMALPFLALTIVHSIISLRRDETGANPTSLRIMVYLPLAMVLAAVVSIAVSWVICAAADTAVANGIGPLIAAFDKADANFVEVSLAAPDSVEPSLLARLVTGFIPENIFHALATANIGQMIVFLIIFSIAILNLAPGYSAGFLEVVGAARRPFEHLMEAMQYFVPVAVFMYAIHASHAVSAADFSALKLLFGVVAAASLAVLLAAVLLVAVLTLKSPLAVASDLKASALAGILAMTEEAALPEMLRRIRRHSADSEDDDTQEIVASLGLSIGRFGMIAILASVLTYTLALYDLPASLSMLASVVALSVLAAVLISGLNGPGVFAASIAFCGMELGLPVEALAVLVIVLEPLLELLLIPVSVAVTHALVEVVSASTARAKRISAAPALTGDA